MRSIVFDTGPIISLTLNDLLGVFSVLKKRFEGEFLITPSIRDELVDTPLSVKRFELEALRVLNLIEKKVLSVIDLPEVGNLTNRMMVTANSIFKAKGKNITIVHRGEIEGLALAHYKHADAFVVDERTTRYLIECPDRLHLTLSSKLHTDVQINVDKLNQFRKLVKGINVIRSSELAVVAYELGLLDNLLPEMRKSKEKLLDALLWGIKLRGCAISEEEIEVVKKIVLRQPY